MKNLLRSLFVFTLISATAAPAWAVSINECAIWLCAPAGFPSGCGAAKSAMLKRIKKFKPPLPSLKSCAKKNPAFIKQNPDYKALSSDYGFAALMPATKRCKKWDKKGNHCIGGYVSTPEHYIKKTKCIKSTSKEDWYPHGCIATYRYIEIFKYKKQIPKTYYW